MGMPTHKKREKRTLSTTRLSAQASNEGPGNLDIRESCGLDAPERLVGYDDALIDEHLDQLLDVEWIAICAVHDHGFEVRRNHLDSVEYRSSEIGALTG